MARLEEKETMSDKPLNGNWLDEWGSCRVCGGEIPHGHTNNCDIFKMEQTERRLRDALGNLVDAVNAEFPGGVNIGGKTGPALICAVDALAIRLDVPAVIEAQKHAHEKPLQLD